MFGKKRSPWAEYKERKSVTLVIYLAGLLLTVGILTLIAVLVILFRTREYIAFSAGLWIQAGIGLGCIVLSAFLFLIANLADDVHCIACLLYGYTKADYDQRKLMLDHIRGIEENMVPQRENINSRPRRFTPEEF